MRILPNLCDERVTLEGSKNSMTLDTYLAGCYLQAHNWTYGVNFDRTDALKKARERYKEEITNESIS